MQMGQCSAKIGAANFKQLMTTVDSTTLKALQNPTATWERKLKRRRRGDSEDTTPHRIFVNLEIESKVFPGKKLNGTRINIATNDRFLPPYLTDDYFRNTSSFYIFWSISFDAYFFSVLLKKLQRGLRIFSLLYTLPGEFSSVWKRIEFYLYKDYTTFG